MLDPVIERRRWQEQRAIDDKSYSRQLAHVLSHSALYREKLGRAGLKRAEEAGGLDEIAALPLTGKDDIRASVTRDKTWRISVKRLSTLQLKLCMSTKLPYISLTKIEIVMFYVIQGDSRSGSVMLSIVTAVMTLFSKQLSSIIK